MLYLHRLWSVKTAVPLCGGGDGVYDLDDAVQGRVCADGHVRPTEVIIDGANHPHNVQVRGRLGLLLCNLAWTIKQTFHYVFIVKKYFYTKRDPKQLIILQDYSTCWI